MTLSQDINISYMSLCRGGRDTLLHYWSRVEESRVRSGKSPGMHLLESLGPIVSHGRLLARCISASFIPVLAVANAISCPLFPLLSLVPYRPNLWFRLQHLRSAEPHCGPWETAGAAYGWPNVTSSKMQESTLLKQSC